jgi:hypothetical protein
MGVLISLSPMKADIFTAPLLSRFFFSQHSPMVFQVSILLFPSTLSFFLLPHDRVQDPPDSGSPEPSERPALPDFFLACS